VRTIVRTMALVSGHGESLVFEATLDQALERVQQNTLPGRPSASDMLAAVHGLFAAVGERTLDGAAPQHKDA